MGRVGRWGAVRRYVNTWRTQGRVNRPGAKTFEYSGGGPQFGQYRPPPKKLMKDVKDKYKFRTYGEKREMDEEAMSKLDSVFGSSSAPSSDGTTVEVVGADAGPKTAEQKALEKVPLRVRARVRVCVMHDPMFVIGSVFVKG